MDDYDIGVYKYKNGQYREAIQCFQNCITQGLDRKQKGDVYTEMGKCYYKLKEFDNSINYLKKALQINPDNGNALVSIGNTYIAKASWADAYRTYSKSLETYNTNPGIHRQLCFCLVKMQRYIEAEKEIDTCLFFEASLGKDNITSNIYKCCVMNFLQRYEEVIKKCDEEWLPKYEENLDFIEQKVLALCELKMIKQCLNLIQTYINKAPNLYYYKAKCYYYQKEYNKALMNINEGLSKKNDINDKMEILKGDIIKEKTKGPNQESIDCYLNAIKTNPKIVEPYMYAALMYMDLNRNKEAVQLIDKVDFIDLKEQEKSYLLFFLTKAQAYFKVGRNNEASNIVLQVRKAIDSEMEKIYSKEILLDIYYKYFQIYHLSKGFSEKDFYCDDSKNNEIGYGGFCRVYKGVLKGKNVAIKKYKFQTDGEYDFDKEYREIESIYKEVVIMESLNENRQYSNFYLSVVSLFYIKSCLYLVSPLCKGGNLRALLKNKSINIPMKARIEITIQIAKALEGLHKYSDPYIHRDLKCLNILLKDNFNPNRFNEVVLCDFGLCKKGRPLACVGTHGWIPPEIYNWMQLREYKFYKSDIYSFGVTMWEIFSREHPFAGIENEAIINKVQSGEYPGINACESGTPELVKILIKQCFNSEPDERPDSTEIIDTLTSCLFHYY